MTINALTNLAQPLIDQIRGSQDAACILVFSKEEDCYEGTLFNMDAGDALILVQELMERFKLSPEALAAI